MRLWFTHSSNPHMIKKLLSIATAILSTMLAVAECPNSIFSNATTNCHMWNFEIGSAQGSPQVTWNFGDGSQVTAGHFIEHNYLLPGEYTVNAYYTSNSCVEGVNLSTVINVTCNCTGVSASFLSNMPSGGPSYVQWNIATIGGSIFNQGVCQFSNSDPDCSANLCLEDGCYRFTITAANSLSTNVSAFQTSMLLNGQLVDTFDPEFNSAGNVYHFSFSVNSDCNNVCNLDVNVTQQTTDLLILTASGQPSNAVVHWTQNGTSVNEGNITTFVLQHGVNEICASYETPECPQGVFWCGAFSGPENNACPESLVLTEMACGYYYFSAPEANIDQYVHWYYSIGENNYDPISQGNGFVSQMFTESGIYEICGVYHSMQCPSIELCETIEVGNCNEPCSLELVAMELESGLYEFTAYGYPEEYPMMWNFGDGTTLEATWVTMHEFAPGTYEVCASTNTVLCGSQTACVSVVIPNQEPLCDIGIDILQQNCEYLFLTATGIGNNNAVIWKLDGEIYYIGLYGEFELTQGTHEICAYYESAACGELVFACETFEVGSCLECSPVIVGIDSYVNNGGTPSLYFNLFNQTTNQQVVFDQIQYSAQDPYHDLSLCLPDGCYTLTVDNNNEIQLGEGVFVFININDEPANYEVIMEDAISFTLSFGVNSDCSTSTDCQAAFEIVEGDVPGNYAFFNASQNPENAQWIWDFGNGETSTDLHPYTTFTEPGTNEVCLTMFVGDCESTICHQLVYEEFIECQFTNIQISVAANYDNNTTFDLVNAVLMSNGIAIDNWSATLTGQLELSFNVCIPDGCYSLQFNSMTPLLANYLIAQVSINGEPINVIEILQGATNGALAFGVNTNCTIDVNDAELASLQIYPNPCNEFVNVQIPASDKQSSIQIFDAIGNLVKAINSNTSLTRIETGDLSNGMYLVKINSGEKTTIKNFVVNY